MLEYGPLVKVHSTQRTQQCQTLRISSSATRLQPLRFHPPTNGHNLVEVVPDSSCSPKVGADAPTLGWRPMPLWGIQFGWTRIWDGIPLCLADDAAPGHPDFMPQSLSAVYIHLVFSTKDRRPLLRDKTTRDAL